MVTLGEILKPRHVDLAMDASEPIAAVAQLAELLQGDNRITNWAEFQGTLCRSPASGMTTLSCGAILCHARTEGVASMLMAAGRLAAPVAQRASGHAEAEGRPRYVFVIGLPPTMASEYLRIVGALARTLKNDATIQSLDDAESPEDFVTVLSRGELSL